MTEELEQDSLNVFPPLIGTKCVYSFLPFTPLMLSLYTSLGKKKKCV